jgi:uncharacterized protein (DUF427 family)
MSEEVNPGFKFTTVGGYWEETRPNGTNIELDVRFKANDEWSDWMKTPGEEDPFLNDEDQENGIKKYTTASTNEADSMQYRFTMFGDGINSPKVKNIDWTFINTAESTSFTEAPSPKFSSLGGVSKATYVALASKDKDVVSRKTWGADESYRYLSSNDIDPVLIEIDDTTYEKYKDELKYSKVVEKDENGDKYKWPLQYPEDVKKIIIHHTATTSNLDNPKQAIRDIYYYHAITRGWGDIGYNYVMDQDGLIYEGRYGGEGVIAAHAGIGNNGSIGIAVLGNYETSDADDKVIESLGKFLAKKTKLHGIDAEGFSEFRGQIMDNIFGHKDIMSTACPGANLYEKLPAIRKIAATYVDEKEKFVKEFDYQNQTDLYYLELKPSESYSLTLEVENIGTEDWDANTYVIVSNLPEFEGVLTFPGNYDGDKIIAKMEESYVKSGETATFKINLKAGTKGDIVTLHISPLMNGYRRSTDMISIPVSVEQTNYKYEYVDSKYPEKTMEKGESFKGWVKLKNTGNVTWKSSGANTVILGTDHEKDRESAFIEGDNKSRIGYLVEESVAPGETGTFELNLVAPEEGGYYKEYFTPVVEGVTWMTDSGIYFETTVFGGLYEGEFVEAKASEEWMKGSKYLIVLKIRNVGQETWKKEDISAGVIKHKSITINGSELLTDEVAPGDVGMLTVSVELGDDISGAKRSMLIRPKVKGKEIMKNAIKVSYRVKNKYYEIAPDSPSEEEEGEEKDIRIRLTPDETPIIGANGDFDVYNRTSVLESYDKTATFKSELNDSKIKITSGQDTYEKVGPIRFVPKGSTILNVNGSEYRGILELQIVDNEVAIINELPLEEYLQGLAEEPNNEEYEKIKAIMVAARSYALFYMEKAEKFPGKPYNLDDDPAVSQKYMGYSFEKNAPNVVKAVNETEGQVVYYDGELVKTPYFSKSDGVATKSAKEVWNWDAPYLVSVDDSYCDSKVFWGHGVGLSGCGAKGMAQNGSTYIEILKHYYTGVEIVDLY